MHRQAKSNTNQRERIEDVLYNLESGSSLNREKRVELIKLLKECLWNIQTWEQEQKVLSLVGDKLHSGMVITDAKRRIEWINKAYAEMSGYTFHESRGLKPGELLQGKQSNPEQAHRMSRKLQKGVPFSEELLNYKKNGESFWVRINITPVFNKKGKIKNYIGVQENITAQKNEEADTKRDSKLFKSFTTHADFAIEINDNEGRYIFVNHKWRKLFGLEKEEVIGKTDHDIFSDSIAKLLHAQNEAVLRKNEKVVIKEWIKTRHGIRCFSLNKFPLGDIPGKDRVVGGTVLDITEMKLKDETVKKSEARLNEAQRIAHIGSWELDLVTNNLIWSDEIYRIFEIDQDKFKASYEAFLNTIHPEDRELVDKTYKESLEKKTTYNITHRLQFPEGRIKYVQEQCEHFYDEKGKTVRSIGTVQDVTERENARMKMNNALKEKKILLAEIHHRVKNNLAVVSGMLQLQWLEEENPEVADKLQDSFNRIKTIANIHEQLYQSERFSDLNLADNLKRLVLDIIAGMNTDRQIALKCNCDPVQLNLNQTLPVSLLANEVITNILKHAFPGRKKGEIEINLSMKDDNVELKIKDDGIGFPKDFEITETNSLGTRLIDTLAHQLNGVYEYEATDNGTIFRIKFEKIPVV